MVKRKINENGYFVEDVITEDIDNSLIEVPVPEGFYKPKWTGNEWVEGATVEEISAIKNKPQEPSEIEKLRQENIEIKLAIAEMIEMFGGAM